MTIRNRRKQAKAWMVLNDIRNVDIKNALNLNHHTQIAETLSGKRNNRQVLQYLLDKGCPVEFLYPAENIGNEQ